MKKQIIIAGLGIGSLLLSSCGTMTPENKQLFAMETGGMIGSATGSLIGDQIGGWGGDRISLRGRSRQRHWSSSYQSQHRTFQTFEQ